MKGIYGDTFILQFMVDHFCGHDRQRKDGINANAMNVGHGGRKHIMNDSEMTKKCLGEFVSGGFSILKVGDAQNIIFKPNDVGPYDIPIYERE